MKDLMNMKQYPVGKDGKGGESLTAYTKRFKTTKDIMTGHIGSRYLLAGYSLTTDEYRNAIGATAQGQVLDKQFEEFMAYLLIENADKEKYGSLLKTLRSKYSMTEDKYPRTIEKAINMLSEHPHDNSKTRRQQQRDSSRRNDNQESEQGQTNAQDKSNVVCHACGKNGHYSTECEWAKKNTDRSK